MRVRPIFFIVLLGAAPVDAQTPTPPPASDAPTPPANYEYQPDNRRDPFLSLVNRGTDVGSNTARGERPEGLPGLTVEEIVVRGVVKTRDGWIAMVSAPTGRTYTVRAGDRLMDGAIRAITADSVVLTQEVDDPLSLEKQREVRKYLRGEVK